MNLNMNNGASGLPGILFLAVAAYWVAIVVIHICFAVSVHWDAIRVSYRGRLIFVSPWIWALGVLFGGVFVAAAYWAMHHSRLNPLIPQHTDDVAEELE